MNHDDKKRFAELVTGHAEMHGKPVTKAGLRIWWNGLSRYSFEQVDAAFQAQAIQSEFMPKLAEIVRQIEGTPDEVAMEAWQKVIYALSRIGSGNDWVFDDPKIHEVLVAMGGSDALARVTEDELPFRRSEFEKRYKAAKGENYPPRIAGWMEEKRTVLIGDPRAARNVLTGGRECRHQLTHLSEALEQGIRQLGLDGAS